MKPKLLIFDLDGTLVDSAPDIIAAVNSLLVELKHAPLHPDLIRAAIGEGFRRLLWDLFPAQSNDAEFLAHLESRLMHYYDLHLLETTHPYPGAIEFLKSTECKIAMVTNKPMRFTDKTLRGRGFSELPWVCVFGGDSLEKKKPDPLPLNECMRLAGATPAETLMIGDGIPDMLAAKAAGVRAIACEFGYTPVERLRELHPAALFQGYPQLAQVIEQL